MYDPQASQQQLKAAQSEAAYEAMDETELARQIRRLEQEMLEHARNLEFEQAAQARDRLREFKDRLFGVSKRDAAAVDQAVARPVPGKKAQRAAGRRHSW